MAADILIVDDEADITSLISDILKDEKYSTRIANKSDSALKALAERVPSAIILDIWLQGSELDGLGILEFLAAMALATSPNFCILAKISGVTCFCKISAVLGLRIDLAKVL